VAKFNERAPKACEKLHRDGERLLNFYNFPKVDYMPSRIHIIVGRCVDAVDAGEEDAIATAWSRAGVDPPALCYCAI
jgi:hypothetical protein